MASTSASAEHTKSRPCFGRQADIAYLLDRTKSTGLTAVVGPPQVGKTRLLRETRDRLREHGFVVGYAESTGEHSDLLVRALKDACAHASAADGLNASLEKAKDDRAGVLAQVSVAVLAAVLPGELQGIIDLTRRAAAEVGSTGLELPRVTYDETFSLAAFLATVSEHPTVLFLDAWQRCSPVAEAAALLQRFLGHADTWPACHMVLGVGVGDATCHEANACLTDLDRSSPLAEVRELGAMDLRDSSESQRVLDCLADEVPAAREIEPALALRLLDGCPGVLHRWLKMKPETLEELEQLAEDARLHRYPELHGLFREQCRSAPRVACFLAAMAILSQMNDESVWRPLAPVLLKGLGEETVWALQADGVLESVDDAGGVPSYGHDTRHDAARCRWLSEDEPVLRPVARGEIRRLIPELAEHVTDLGEDSSVFVAALASILEHQADLQLKGSPLFLCECAASLLSSWTRSLDPDLLRSQAAETARDCPRAATLVAMALANTQYLAGQEGDRACGDVLLDELRRLCARRSGDAAVRERLAVALVNAVDQASREGDWACRDALLKELRGLCVGHPGDAAVRGRLAVALVNAMDQASREGDWAFRDALLRGLRSLYAQHAGDAVVRERLAMALVNAVDQAAQERDRARRSALFDELRRLYGEHPGDAAVRERLAMALANAVDLASQEGRPACRDALLEELRQLYAEHPGDAAVRGRLAMALVHAVNLATQEGHPVWRDASLRELRGLYAEHTDDATVRERLAAALHDGVVHTRQEEDRGWRDALLDELRGLCTEHPDDTAVRERLTMALFNMPALAPPDRG